ncbi:MAG: hypothetical protein PF481_09080 [Bacteroidales bacterium]|jgi:hypothetical protein|nr:hypothetical protein [Bacteroidales bacterium]
MNTHILELSGYIKKQEEFSSLDIHKIKGTMVLQTVKPFNGYYANEPEEYIPQTVLLITKKDYSQETIVRLAKNISLYLDITIDAVKSEVVIYNELHHAVRLYDVKNYSEIERIQRAFSSEGIEFKNSDSKYNDNYIVTIHKTFLVQEIEKGVFMNQSKSKMFYFEIPKNLSFSHFLSLDEKVRNNWDGKMYSAAPGIFFRKTGVQDVIRIFSNHISNDMIQGVSTLFKRFI